MSGGSDVEWGNGQPGNQSYSGPENDYAPSYDLPVGPNSFPGANQAPFSSGGPAFQPVGGGEANYGYGGGSSGAMAPLPAGTGSGSDSITGSDPSYSGSGGFDPSVFQNLPTLNYDAMPAEWNLGDLNLGSTVSSAPGSESFAAANPSAISSLDPSGNPGPSFGPGATSLSGLPGVTDPNNDPTSRGAQQPGATSMTPSVGPGGTAIKARTQITPDGGGFSLEKLLGNNPMGALIAGGGLAYNMAQGQQQRPSTQSIQTQAAQIQEMTARLDANGQKMKAFLESGDLPPGLRTSLNQATASAKAKIISNYAAQGMPTDPTKNSALAQQLQMVDQQAIITTAQIGQQLYSTGLQESGLALQGTGMASDLYKTLSNIDQTQTDRIGKAIASMAAAFNSGGGRNGGVNLRIG